jgi:hypothetical protein
METIRIPSRYKKIISRLSSEEKAWILDSLFSLAEGNDAVVKDSFAGDTLEQIWRDCVMMEKKNKHNAEYVGGVCASPEAPSVVTPSYDEPTTGCEEKRREEKGKERKGREGKPEKIPAVPAKQIEKFFFQLAEYFFSKNGKRYLANVPKKAKDIPALLLEWAEHFEKMERIDGCTREQSGKILRWLFESGTKDSIFWMKNILHPGKLREKKNKDDPQYWRKMEDLINFDGFEKAVEKSNNKGSLNFNFTGQKWS